MSQSTARAFVARTRHQQAEIQRSLPFMHMQLRPHATEEYIAWLEASLHDALGYVEQTAAPAPDVSGKPTLA